MSAEKRKCERCEDDGWIEIMDEETGGVVGAMDCPYLDEPWHREWNGTKLLGERA